MKEVEQDIDSIAPRDNLAEFLKDPENALRLNCIVEDVRYALMDYQVCAPLPLILVFSNDSLRPRCDETSTTRAVKRWSVSLPPGPTLFSDS